MSEKIRRYAQDTRVPIGRSKDELSNILRKAGASQTLMGSDDDRGMILVGFTLDKRQIRVKASTVRPSRKCDAEQLEREAWRALVLIVKAKLEIVAMGQSTVEQEFLANIVLPDGSTVGDDVLPKISQAYETGHMPKLLPA